jgi:hypothetical protein
VTGASPGIDVLRLDRHHAAIMANGDHFSQESSTYQRTLTSSPRARIYFSKS